MHIYMYIYIHIYIYVWGCGVYPPVPKAVHGFFTRETSPSPYE